MENDRPWDLALDRPGSANTATLLGVSGVAILMLLIGAVALVSARSQLEPSAHFISFYAGFVFVANLVTAIFLYSQYIYRRLPLYVVLGSAYLFDALIIIPFVLSLPGGIIDGPQSALWIWHLWHVVFPLIVAWALLHGCENNDQVSHGRAMRGVFFSVLLTVLFVAAVGVFMGRFHHVLPELHTRKYPTLPHEFYVLGAAAALLTVVAILLAFARAWHRRVLHIWLGVTLIAFLVDITFNLGVYAPYSVGWYFGHSASMFSASILLLVFLSHHHHLHSKLAAMMQELVLANNRLVTLMKEKGSLQVELRNSQNQVRTLAFRDPVTGLANRLLLAEHLRKALEHAKRYRHSTAVLLLNLDRFADLSQQLGPEGTDWLLKAIGQRLTRCVRSEDTVARVGGDEFVIVVPEVAQHQDAVVVATKVLELLNEKAFELRGRHIRVTASVGIAIREANDDFDPGYLLKKAAAAMQTAKRGGGNRFSLAEIE